MRSSWSVRLLSMDEPAQEPQPEEQPDHPGDDRAPQEGAQGGHQQHQAEGQRHQADQRTVHAQGSRQAFEKIVSGVGKQAEEAAECIDDVANHRAERLAQPLEEAFHPHVFLLPLCHGLQAQPFLGALGPAGRSEFRGTVELPVDSRVGKRLDLERLATGGNPGSHHIAIFCGQAALEKNYRELSMFARSKALPGRLAAVKPRVWLLGALAFCLLYTATTVHLDERLFFTMKTAWLEGCSKARALWLPEYEVRVDALPVATVNNNLSGLTFDERRDHLWTVINNPEELVALGKDGTFMARYPLSGFSDVEGVTYLGDDLLVLAEERKQ